MKIRLIAATAAVLLGCSGGGGGVSHDKLNEELSKAVCQMYVRCGLAHSEAGCLASIGDTLSINPYEASISSGKVVYDGAAARKCLDTYAMLACTGGLAISADESCRQVYTGQLKLGDVCTNDVECSRDAFCASGSSGQMCMGTCTARIAEGATATEPTSCAEGLTVIDGKCARPPALGAMCSQTTPCDIFADLYCGSAGTCVKAEAEGATCDTSRRCSLFLSCVNGKCAKPADVNASCGPSGASCMTNLFCEFQSSTCKEPLAQGAACVGGGCMRPLVCAGPSGSTACTPPTAENGSCVNVGCDEKTYCDSDSKICKKRIAVGQTCTTATPCETNAFCNGGKCQSFTTTCP